MAMDRVPVWYLTVSTVKVNLEAQRGLNLAVRGYRAMVLPLGALTFGSSPTSPSGAGVGTLRITAKVRLPGLPHRPSAGLTFYGCSAMGFDSSSSPEIPL